MTKTELQDLAFAHERAFFINNIRYFMDFEGKKQIFLINIFRSSSTYLKKFCMLYQQKILNLIFGISFGRRPYHMMDEIILRQKLAKITKKCFFDKIKKIFLINIFWTSGTQKIEFCMLYEEKILNLRFW